MMVCLLVSARIAITPDGRSRRARRIQHTTRAGLGLLQALNFGLPVLVEPTLRLFTARVSLYKLMACDA